MAKIKFGLVVTDARGKLGGHVFSKNRGGSYLRTKVVPVNPQTGAQTIVRQSFAFFSQNWSALTALLIASWNNAVTEWQKTDVFGDVKNPTGKNLYLRLNQTATQAGYPSFTNVPPRLPMVEGIVTDVFMGNGIEVVGLYNGSDARVVLSSSGVVSNGTSYVKNKMRNFYNALASEVSDADVLAAYVSKYGTPDGEEKIFFGINYVLPNGQKSPMQIIQASNNI